MRTCRRVAPPAEAGERSPARGPDPDPREGTKLRRHATFRNDSVPIMVHGMAFVLGDRASGVLLHLTSLPGAQGCGDLGPQAHAFARALAKAGQGWWQMLPVGPVGYGNSPYSAQSAFAGDPLLISLDLLVEDGLLPRQALEGEPPSPPGRVDYARVRPARERHLATAFNAFGRRTADHSAFEMFCAENAGWLEDFALYTAIKSASGEKAWTGWQPELRARDPGALDRARHALRDGIHQRRFEQFVFARQWQALRDECR